MKTPKTPATPDVHDARAMGRLGGKARAAKLTPEERQAISRKGGLNAPGWPKGKPRGPRANWGKGKPFGTPPRIYVISAYGDTGYYRTLEAAATDLHNCGEDYKAIRLTVHGQLIKNQAGETVGELIAEGDVPAKHQWQLQEQA